MRELFVAAIFGVVSALVFFTAAPCLASESFDNDLKLEGKLTKTVNLPERTAVLLDGFGNAPRSLPIEKGRVDIDIESTQGGTLTVPLGTMVFFRPSTKMHSRFVTVWTHFIDYSDETRNLNRSLEQPIMIVPHGIKQRGQYAGSVYSDHGGIGYEFVAVKRPASDASATMRQIFDEGEQPLVAGLGDNRWEPFKLEAEKYIRSNKVSSVPCVKGKIISFDITIDLAETFGPPHPDPTYTINVVLPY